MLRSSPSFSFAFFFSIAMLISSASYDDLEGGLRLKLLQHQGGVTLYVIDLYDEVHGPHLQVELVLFLVIVLLDGPVLHSEDVEVLAVRLVNVQADRLSLLLDVKLEPM